MLSASAAGVATLAAGAALSRLSVFAPQRKIMVAVLPLADPGADPKQGYFATVLHIQIIRMLGRLYPDRLGVIAFESVKQYKGTKRRIDQIGRELKVDYVVEGEVRREGDRVRIAAQLIRVKDQAQLWNTTYERDLRHILALQAEVAQAVAQGIESKLRPNPQVQLAIARPLDPEAYEAYLRGDYEKSIQLNPYYAPAYVRLANSHIFQRYSDSGRPSRPSPRCWKRRQKRWNLTARSRMPTRLSLWRDSICNGSGVKPRMASAALFNSSLATRT